eukprot:658175-Hanusia_phi.AAC.1
MSASAIFQPRVAHVFPASLLVQADAARELVRLARCRLAQERCRSARRTRAEPHGRGLGQRRKQRG